MLYVRTFRIAERRAAATAERIIHSQLQSVKSVNSSSTEDIPFYRTQVPHSPLLSRSPTVGSLPRQSNRDAGITKDDISLLRPVQGPSLAERIEVVSEKSSPVKQLSTSMPEWRRSLSVDRALARRRRSQQVSWESQGRDGFEESRAVLGRSPSPVQVLLALSFQSLSHFDTSRRAPSVPIISCLVCGSPSICIFLLLLTLSHSWMVIQVPDKDQAKANNHIRPA